MKDAYDLKERLAARKKTQNTAAYSDEELKEISRTKQKHETAPGISQDRIGREKTDERGNPRPAVARLKNLTTAKRAQAQRSAKDPPANPEEEIECAEERSLRKGRKAKARQERVRKTGTVVLCIACVYLVFLIYGVANTDYEYGPNGSVRPVAVGIHELTEKKNLDNAAAYYMSSRSIYEKALMLDYRIAAGMEDPLLIGPGYDALLEDINVLTIQLDAASVPPQYAQVLEMTSSWVANDMAIYCQNMSAAIARNDPEKAQNALEYKDICYRDFKALTRAFAALASQVQTGGAIARDITGWSPEGYITKETGLTLQ